MNTPVTSINHGNESGKEWILQLSDSENGFDVNDGNAIEVEYIIDISATEGTQVATYNPIDKPDDVKFGTTTTFNLSGTYLITPTQDAQMTAWLRGKNTIYARYGLSGNATGSAYTQRTGFITQLDLSKNGTNAYERPFNFAGSGAPTTGTYS